MTSTLRRVSTLLFFSGACALVYQVAWFRELRLIFGASTAASAAVLAVFMGGLGFGGAVIGKRADLVKNPLDLYARLEILVALTAAITPGLVWLAQVVYLSTGGSATLGKTGATIARLFLSVLVLGPSTFLMGGTLPAAARAVASAADDGRQRVATLYGTNTFGAVIGAFSANFVLLEVFGTRLTLWLACLVNLLVAFAARAIARSAAAPHETTQDDGSSSTTATSRSRYPRWFPPVAAAVAGFAFMLMELVWYRMLAPLLGGSSYTFGLILALALVGIGIGGVLYSRTRRAATLALFTMTCVLEALTLAMVYALGDRLAIFALLLRPLARASFGGAILSWTLVTSIVVIPTAVVAGYQFPAIIGLYGRGSRDIARHVGNAYLANTLGSIAGSIAGGFGLLPLLSAPRCWQLVAVLLLATGLLAAVLDLQLRRYLSITASAVLGLPTGVALLTAGGPTAAWRHSAIGAGRSDLTEVNRQRLEEFVHAARWEVEWEVDGLESSVALSRQNSYVFMVNGKSDGSVVGDAGTQVMSGMLAALIHGSPRRVLVVGLGTGSTAGWLGAVPGIERVDVVELEPAILRVADQASAANQNVMSNPKVHVTLGDAREVLRTTPERYDVVFSEPSNPYRAGISSLYTEEFYRAAAQRLTTGGLFVQWVQTYEVDVFAVLTAGVTLRRVFPQVEIWQTMHGDLLLVATRSSGPLDIRRMSEQLAAEPYASAARAAWRTDSVEGVLSHFVARPEFVDMLADRGLGAVNTDDQNFLEFAFARSVGNHQSVAADIRSVARRLGVDVPRLDAPVDPSLLHEERLLTQLLNQEAMDAGTNPPPSLFAFAQFVLQYQKKDYRRALEAWASLGRNEPRAFHEALLVAEAAAMQGDDRLLDLLPSRATEADRCLLRGIWLARKGRNDESVVELEKGFAAAQSNPWVSVSVLLTALDTAVKLGANDPPIAEQLARTLSKSFAVELGRNPRTETAVKLARASKNSALCASLLESLEPLPFNGLLYETRAECYRAVQHPRLQQAERDLAYLLSLSESLEMLMGPSPRREGGPRPTGLTGSSAPPRLDMPSADAAAPTPDGAAPSADASASLEAAASASSGSDASRPGAAGAGDAAP